MMYHRVFVTIIFCCSGIFLACGRPVGPESNEILADGSVLAAEEGRRDFATYVVEITPASLAEWSKENSPGAAYPIYLNAPYFIYILDSTTGEIDYSQIDLVLPNAGVVPTSDEIVPMDTYLDMVVTRYGIDMRNAADHLLQIAGSVYYVTDLDREAQLHLQKNGLTFKPTENFHEQPDSAMVTVYTSLWNCITWATVPANNDTH